MDLDASVISASVISAATVPVVVPDMMMDLVLAVIIDVSLLEILAVYNIHAQLIPVFHSIIPTMEWLSYHKTELDIMLSHS